MTANMDEQGLSSIEEQKNLDEAALTIARILLDRWLEERKNGKQIKNVV